MYYASFGLLSIILHFIINFEVIRIPREGDNNVKKAYRFFLRGVMLYYVSDVLWGFLYDLGKPGLIFADTTLYFFSMGLTVLYWMRYIIAYINRDSFRSKLLKFAGWGIFTFQLIMLIINGFTGFMFHVDGSGEYYPRPGRYMALVLQILLFAVLAVYMLILSGKVKGLDLIHYRAIGVSSLVMFGFIILQTAYPLLPFYAVGCLIATCVIHSFVSADERVTMYQQLGNVKQIAYKDPLTNVKNANAYREAKNTFDRMIRDGQITDLAIAVFDVNDLKLVNDTRGHEAGDRYLQECSALICNVFKHSPVYRIGGDEFVAILEGEDYVHRKALMLLFDDIVEDNQKTGKAVVSGHFDDLEPGVDPDFDTVFKRADAKMYERKKELKSRKK